MKSPISVINNSKLKRFETEINGDIAYVAYRFHEDDMVLIHTYVPKSARGKGISTALAEFVLDYLMERNIKIIVHCPFITKYIKQHPQYEVLIDKQFGNPNKPGE